MSTTSESKAGDRPEAAETTQMGQAGTELPTETPPVSDIEITAEIHPNDEQIAELRAQLETALESNERLASQVEDSRAQYAALEAMIGPLTATSGRDQDYVPTLEERVQAGTAGPSSARTPFVQRTTTLTIVTRPAAVQDVPRTVTAVASKGNPWDKGVLSPGDRKHYAATIVSTLIEYLDSIRNAGGDRSAASYPSGRYKRLLLGSAGTDHNAGCHGIAYGLSMDASRATRSGQPWCGAESINRIPRFTKKQQKSHFVEWPLPAAVNFVQEVCKSVHSLFSLISATARVWLTMLPGNHPLHQRAIALTTEGHLIASTIKGFLFTGSRMRNEPYTSPTPCVIFAGNVNSEWLIVAVANVHTVAPHATTRKEITNFMVG
ncbi:hypothetical protein HDU86_001305 [Geranomyces michiganensis]|nr:hypothetical protein HDU86_001305 [Geranomyces michiganensis]